MNYTIAAYFIYLPVTIMLTVWVARTLFKHGRIFLVDIFHQDELVADSVNQLLRVGFYLVNIGYAVYTLRIWGELANAQSLIEILSYKIGRIILVLGGMHFFNMFVLYSLRKKSMPNRISLAPENFKI